jgi:cell wall-associated NlpC family hydrolase
LIVLVIAAGAFVGAVGIARAEVPPPTCGEPTEENPDQEPCPDPLVIPPLPVPNYADIADHWARGAIRDVAYNRDWLRFAGSTFSPNSALKRYVLAYGLVRAFARNSVLDPHLTITDLPKENAWYPYVNVAVSKGWMSAPGGKFNPGDGVTKSQLNVAMARALQMLPTVGAINGISSSDGYRLSHSPALGYSTVAHHLGAYYNFPNSARYEIYPAQQIRRGEFAYALSQLADLGWHSWFLNERFSSVVLPPLTPMRRKVAEFALRYASTPYTYAGTRPTTGMDCSGFVWWVMRAGMGNDSIRGYRGWSLPQRSSYQMAAATGTRIPIYHLRPLDVLFWDVEGPFARSAGAVGHAGLYLGNGWFIHSSGSKAGVALDWMGDGYWRDRFVWGRRLIPSTV